MASILFQVEQRLGVYEFRRARYDTVALDREAALTLARQSLAEAVTDEADA